VTRWALTKYVPFPSLASRIARRRPEPRGCRLDIGLPGWSGPAPQRAPPARCPSGKVGPPPTHRAARETCAAPARKGGLGSSPAQGFGVASAGAETRTASSPRVPPCPLRPCPAPPAAHCLCCPALPSRAPHWPLHSALASLGTPRRHHVRETGLSAGGGQRSARAAALSAVPGMPRRASAGILVELGRAL
jgi:hypothetical protein